MLLLKLLFVAASLITQAYVFRESPEPARPSPSSSSASASASFAAEAQRADSTMYATYGFLPDAGENSSTAESDTSPTGEPCALR